MSNKMSGNLQTDMTYLNDVLAVDKSFDVIYRVIHVGNKEACFYFLDGFCKDEIMQSEEFRKELLTLRSFMFKNVYKSSLVKKEEDLAKVGVVIKALYDYFLEHEEKLPEDLQEIARTEGINEAVKDFVAGMTDRYALSLYTDLFVPKAWK